MNNHYFETKILSKEKKNTKENLIEIARIKRIIFESFFKAYNRRMEIRKKVSKAKAKVTKITV